MRLERYVPVACPSLPMPRNNVIAIAAVTFSCTLLAVRVACVLHIFAICQTRAMVGWCRFCAVPVI